MGKKNKVNSHWFHCPHCGYHCDKETMVEQGYVDELKTGGYCVWCPNPRCELPTVMME